MAAPQKTKVGELRPSQLMLTYGVGSVVELPYLSVMVMGLEDWPASRAEPIREERLLRAVRLQLGNQVEKLLAPPAVADDGSRPFNPFDDDRKVGVPVSPFPRWMVCPYCRILAPLASGIFSFEPEPFRPDRARFVHTNCSRPARPPEAVPARFLVSCSNGHLDDFPWLQWVHQGAQCNGPLRFYETGPSGEAADVQVKCDTCGASRSMALVFTDQGRREMPACAGRRPQLRDYDPRTCGEKARPILLGASNSWFPILLSALSIPSRSTRLEQLLEQQWTDFETIRDVSDFALLRRFGSLREFDEFTDEQIWQALERMRVGEQHPDERDLKVAEWEIFSAPNPIRNSPEMQLRPVPPPERYARQIERVLLAERLREVRALTGFTRIDPPGEDGQAVRAPISRTPPRWVPASEVRGEGIFVQFSEPAVVEWERNSGELDQQLIAAHRRWRTSRGLDPATAYPGLRYALLHSFAHAVIRQFSIECGYSMASLRERIYCRLPGQESPMAGVLIYTAAPDSEGTLGGLVSLGETREFGRHMEAAFEGLELCASDPLCAENLADQHLLALHGAACHACLFAPETSCECGNRYLDRSILVETVERRGWSFFR
jgi:hypothetical protein